VSHASGELQDLNCAALAWHALHAALDYDSNPATTE
jgi:hypothetical protein